MIGAQAVADGPPASRASYAMSSTAGCSTSRRTVGAYWRASARALAAVHASRLCRYISLRRIFSCCHLKKGPWSSGGRGDRQAGEVVDEVERVFDLMGDAGGQLSERRHLLCMQQARLCRLQFPQRLFGGIPCLADLDLSALPLGDVAVNQHKTATRHRVTTHLDDPPVWSRALEAHVSGGIFDGAAQLLFEIGRAIFASIDEITKILSVARPLGEERLR